LKEFGRHVRIPGGRGGRGGREPVERHVGGGRHMDHHEMEAVVFQTLQEAPEDGDDGPAPQLILVFIDSRAAEEDGEEPRPGAELEDIRMGHPAQESAPDSSLGSVHLTGDLLGSSTGLNISKLMWLVNQTTPSRTAMAAPMKRIAIAHAGIDRT